MFFYYSAGIKALMHFLLINPYYPIGETPSPPLGLAYLAAALERAGVKVKILDFVVFPYSFISLEKVMKAFKPDFVGATAVTMTFYKAIDVLQDAKRIDPDVVTVMGGPHITFCAEETLILYPELDCVVLGEGEATIVELIREGKSVNQWHHIPGLVFRIGTEIYHTKNNRPPIDIKTLPLPARHLIPLGRYRALNMPISMTTSRGCPHKCIFCVGRKMVGSRVRYRRPNEVVNELEYLSTLSFPQINIADDLFTADKSHCTAICDEIINRGIKTKWTSFSRVDTVSYGLLKKMKDAGCCCVSFGVETANARILKTIKKGITLQQTINAVNICFEAGIEPTVSFILGLPGETPDTLNETLEFGAKLKRMGIGFGYHLLAPFPGTTVREKSKELGIRILTDDWAQYHANRAVAETEFVTKSMLDAIVVDWEQKYLKLLGEIEAEIKADSADKERASILLNLERTVLLYEWMMDRIIETHGVVDDNINNGSKDDAFKNLVSKIESLTVHPHEKIYRALNHTVSQGDLIYAGESSQRRWRWVDYF